MKRTGHKGTRSLLLEAQMNAAWVQGLYPQTL